MLQKEMLYKAQHCLLFVRRTLLPLPLHVAYLTVLTPQTSTFTPRFYRQPLRLTDYLWFQAQTVSVQAMINTAAIISASSNLPTSEPDDVKKILPQWLGRREIEAS